MRPFLLQKEGSCCGLFGLINALRYLGLNTPEPGDEAWEWLVDKAACRSGGVIGIDELASILLLKRTCIPIEEVGQHAPATLTVLNPEPVGMTLHTVLVIGGSWETGLEMVNYRWRSGPVVETAVPEVMRKGHSNREAHAITRDLDALEQIRGIYAKVAKTLNIDLHGAKYFNQLLDGEAP